MWVRAGGLLLLLCVVHVVWGVHNDGDPGSVGSASDDWAMWQRNIVPAIKEGEEVKAAKAMTRGQKCQACQATLSSIQNYLAGRKVDEATFKTIMLNICKWLDPVSMLGCRILAATKATDIKQKLDEGKWYYPLCRSGEITFEGDKTGPCRLDQEECYIHDNPYASPEGGCHFMGQTYCSPCTTGMVWSPIFLQTGTAEMTPDDLQFHAHEVEHSKCCPCPQGFAHSPDACPA